MIAPQIALPKGGGAIRGIGEKFAANPVTGTGSPSVPIATSPGRSGFGPQLSLSYDSGAGNGAFGFGWALSLPAITRRTDKGLPRYRDEMESDSFILSGAEDLVPVLVQGDHGRWNQEVISPRNGYAIKRYRPRIEGLFARIERWTRQSDGETHRRAISKDNVTSFYGATEESRIADPDDPTLVFSWLICQSQDDRGNAILYSYVPEDTANVDLSQANERNRSAPKRRFTNRYPARIRYGNTPSLLVQPDVSQLSWLFEVTFDYGEGYLQQDPPDAEGRVFASAALTPSGTWPARQDPISYYRACFEVRTYRLCRRVLMFHHFAEELGTPDYLVRSTEFDYKEGPVASFIAAVTLVLDPLGRPLVKQQVMPLNTGRDIETFGGAPVNGARRFQLKATLNSTTQHTDTVQDQFAPAQFFELSDDEKLAAPSFETMDAGLIFGDEAVSFDASQLIAASLQYEQIVIDDLAAPPPPPKAPKQTYALRADKLLALSRSGAAARAPIRTAGRARFRAQDDTPAATLKLPSWSIVPLADGQPATLADGQPATLAPALKTCSEHLAALTTLNRATASWQIVPMHELTDRSPPEHPT